MELIVFLVQLFCFICLTAYNLDRYKETGKTQYRVWFGIDMFFNIFITGCIIKLIFGL